MTRLIMFFIAMGLVLVGCSPDEINTKNEKNTSVVSEVSSTDSPIRTEITPSTEQDVLQDSLEYVAKNEGELSIQDSDTAYKMSVKALTDYYKAVWNGLDIDLDSFIDNEYLKQYTETKIQYIYNLHSNFTDSTDEVRNIEIGDSEVTYMDDVDGGYLYLTLPVCIYQDVGETVSGYCEATEFLVRNVNGKLVIVDWYDGGKDSYDFLVRGENLTIDNPNIWDNSEWVKKIDLKQNDFSGSIR